MELEESTFLISEYTTKLQSLRQYGTGTKAEKQTNGTRQKAEINPRTFDHLIFDKGGKNLNGEKSHFNKWCWENWKAMYKRMKLECFLTPHTKINSKWIKDLNVKPETIKILEENIGRTLNDINQSKILYDPPPRATEIKTKQVGCD